MLNFSHPCILIRKSLGRHSSHWRCEIVHAGSSRMSLASKQISRSKTLSHASRFCVTRFHEFFKKASPYEKFSALMTNHRVCEEGANETRSLVKKKGSAEYECDACYGNSSGFCCLRRIIATPVRLILRANSRVEFHLEAALETSSSAVAAALPGNIGCIMVEWGTLGISRKTPCLKRDLGEIIVCLKFRRASWCPFLGIPFFPTLASFYDFFVCGKSGNLKHNRS